MTDDAQHWLVVFSGPEPMDRTTAKRRDRFLYWFLTKFLRPGFRHVYMMRRAHGFDGWVVVNPHSTCIDVMEVTGSKYLELVLQRRDEGHCAVLAVVSRRPETWQVRGALSCVSVVSHILGIECGIFTTPWRLYRSISQQRATEASAMGGIFSAPKPPDTSAADEARRKAEQERDDLKTKNEAKVRNRQNRNRGRSLLAFADTGELGVQPGNKTKLGQ